MALVAAVAELLASMALSRTSLAAPRLNDDSGYTHHLIDLVYRRSRVGRLFERREHDAAWTVATGTDVRNVLRFKAHATKFFRNFGGLDVIWEAPDGDLEVSFRGQGVGKPRDILSLLQFGKVPLDETVLVVF